MIRDGYILGSRRNLILWGFLLPALCYTQSRWEIKIIINAHHIILTLISLNFHHTEIFQINVENINDPCTSFFKQPIFEEIDGLI